MGFLELSHVKKRFGAFVAVEDFELITERGEFVSLLGPSGCGKTTTLRMIAGFEYPDSGSIKVDGKEITNLPPNKRNVGMVFQAYALFPNMTVASNVGFGMRVKKQSKDAITKRVGELLEMIHMPEKADRYPYQLSGGQQQRVALARTIAIEPKVLLLDEPLAGLSEFEIQSVLNVLRQRVGRQTILIVEHKISHVQEFLQRLTVMHDGRVIADGPCEETLRHPEVRRSYWQIETPAEASGATAS